MQTYQFIAAKDIEPGMRVACRIFTPSMLYLSHETYEVDYVIRGICEVDGTIMLRDDGPAVLIKSSHSDTAWVGPAETLWPVAV